MDSDDAKTYIGFKAWGFGFDAHLTMVWTDVLSDRQVEDIRKILHANVSSSYFSLAKRLSIEMFGPNKDIPVLTVEPHEELYVLREVLAEHPAIPNPSEFSWNPHITLKAEPMQPLVIPPVIKLSLLDVY